MSHKNIRKGQDLSEFQWSQAKSAAAFLLATEEMTDKQICDTLDISPGTLKAWKSYNEFQAGIKKYADRLAFKLEKHYVSVLSKNLGRMQAILDRKLSNKDVQRSMDTVALLREVRMYIGDLAKLKQMNLPESEDTNADDYRGASLVDELLGQLPEEARDKLRSRLIDKAREIVNNKRVDMERQQEET